MCKVSVLGLLLPSLVAAGCATTDLARVEVSLPAGAYGVRTFLEFTN